MYDTVLMRKNVPSIKDTEPLRAEATSGAAIYRSKTNNNLIVVSGAFCTSGRCRVNCTNRLKTSRRPQYKFI